MLCASNGVGVPPRLLVCLEHVMVAALSCCCSLRNKKAILNGRISGKAHGFHFQFELFCVKTEKKKRFGYKLQGCHFKPPC